MPDSFTPEADADAHNPGGKVSIPLPAGVAGRALFGGPRDCYRYTASYRHVGVPEQEQAAITWILMNPSLANGLQFDPTLFKCWKITNALGYRKMLIGNVFAYRCTDQSRLAETPNPVGQDNDRYLDQMAQMAGMVIMAYGTPKIPALRARGPEVARMLIRLGVPLHVVGLSKEMAPLHPLYQKDNSVPVPWAGPDRMESANAQ